VQVAIGWHGAQLPQQWLRPQVGAEWQQLQGHQRRWRLLRQPQRRTASRHLMTTLKAHHYWHCWCQVQQQQQQA